MATPFVGEICALPYTYAPLDWAFCNGQQVNVMQFQALYSILGNTFGGTPNQTFLLPNLKANTVMGCGSGPGLTTRLYAKTVGAPSVTLNSTQLPNHDHSTLFALGRSPDAQPNPTGNYLGQLAEYPSGGGTPVARWIYEKTAPVNVQFAGAALLPAGSGGAHENQQPFLAINFCIALNGEYPVRP